jgi:hypothetical protein
MLARLLLLQALEARLSGMEQTAAQLEAARQELSELRACLDDKTQRVQQLEEVGLLRGGGNASCIVAGEPVEVCC